MPKQTIVQYLDDLDGKPLSDDAEPIELTYDGITYKLYLSDVNEKKLSDFLAKYTDGAEEVRAVASVRSAGAKSDAQQTVEQAGRSFAEVKAWALQKGTYTTAKGEPIAESAPRLSEKVWQDFADEHNL